jgi:hypothetical protein
MSPTTEKALRKKLFWMKKAPTDPPTSSNTLIPHSPV